ncbi:MAG: magnesium-translocating P-type ATPase [Candidatus Micrarchaeia archaeon]
MPDFSVESPQSLSEAGLCRALGVQSPSAGLSGDEARRRLSLLGKNEVAERDRKTAFSIMFSQFQNPLIYLLAIASGVSVYLGSVTEGLVIIAVVVLNAGLGFLQEYRAESALQKLKRLVSFSAEVVRDGKKSLVDSADVVSGDVVFVQPGDKIPADFRITSCEEFEVDEATLTGESLPVAKTCKPMPKGKGEIVPSEARNIAFAGSIVVRGHATGLVFATGGRSFFGRTARVMSARVPQTSFEQRIRDLGGLLLRITFAMTAFVFLVNALFGRGLLSSFLFALALAVGITPEALPMVITMGLSYGALGLAKKRVVVKKLAVLENLGNMDVLCFDKTGTLTENMLVLEHALSLDGSFSREVLESAVMCNTLFETRGKARAKNPFDAAVLELAGQKLGEKRVSELFASRVLDFVDFDFARKRMSVAVKRNGKTRLVTKGAWENMLPACSKELRGGGVRPISPKSKKLLEGYAAKGFSVVALAYREFPKQKNFSPLDERGMVLAGALLFASPPKRTSAHAVSELRSLGVELKLFTGDGALSTKKLCGDVGFPIIGGRIVLGKELDGLSQSELSDIAGKCNVFSRVTPEQKFALVLALRGRGHVVGFIGDGVNDAPALRASDVGISVDNAVDVARDAAHIILLGKSLDAVLAGVTAGRRIFGNISKYLFNTLSANFGNMFTVAASSVFLKFIPMLPSQILLNNLLSDVPMLTLPSDNVDRAFLRKPRKWNLDLLFQFMWRFGLLSFVFDLMTIAAFIYWMALPIDAFRTAWFLESVLSEIIITFAVRTQGPFWQSAPSPLLVLSSVGVAALSVWLLYSPFAGFFNLVPLQPQDLAVITGILLAYFASAEFMKEKFFKEFTL